MIYAYDLLINESSLLYDFYDWADDDKFIHVRRVPLFKVNDKTYMDLLCKKIRIDKEFLSMIKDKTQVFMPTSIETKAYSAIFTNGINAIYINFNKGINEIKSKFLVPEEIEIINLSNKMKETDINYNIIGNKIILNKVTRKEKNRIALILKQLETIKNKEEKINYIYYEWFGNNECDNKYDKLVNDIKKNYTNKHEEILEILDLMVKNV